MVYAHDLDHYRYTDSTLLVNDTAEFVMLRRNTMALRFNDHIQGFKLKPDSIK